jgi:molybdate transport system ATP-binding protein
MSLDASITCQIGMLALRVDLGVQPGELVALLGPNGAGKSSLLRCLAGLAPLHAGRIVLDGTTVDDPATGVFVEPEQRSVGFVFQNYLLFDHLTVLDNVAFGLRARKVPRAAARLTAHGWLERVGLDTMAHERPGALSGGQAQRAALARAMATDPRLLLLDEPLAALDAGTRGLVRRDLRRHLATFDGMRILVTHDPVDAYALADRVVILDGGAVVQSGTLTEVTAHPRSRYVADLVGVNLVGGIVSDGVLTSSAGGGRVVVSDAIDGPSFALIRPHSIALVREATAGSSVRNLWRGVVGDIDRLGERARVGVEGELSLTAEITIAALAALDLRPGDEIYASAKATDIEVYPA